MLSGYHIGGNPMDLRGEGGPRLHFSSPKDKRQLLSVTFVDWTKLIFCVGRSTDTWTNLQTHGETDLHVEIVI